MLLFLLPVLLLAAAAAAAEVPCELSPLPAKLLQEQQMGGALGTQCRLPQLQPALLASRQLQLQHQVGQTVLRGPRVSCWEN